MNTDRWSKPAASPESDQVVKELGCENSEAHRPRAFETARKKARLKTALLMQRPIITVPFHFGSELVDIQVLTVRTKNATPAVEASAANFRAMFCWCRIEEANTLGVTPSHTRSLIPPPRQGLLHKEYFRSDRKCWVKKRSTPDQKKELKQFPGEFSDQKTMVCIRQMLGRPRKRAQKVDASSDSCAAGESNSACESTAQSEHPDALMAASPSDSTEAEFCWHRLRVRRSQRLSCSPSLGTCGRVPCWTLLIHLRVACVGVGVRGLFRGATKSSVASDSVK